MTSQVNDTIQQLLNKITQQVAILAHQVDMLQIHNLLDLVPLSLAELSTKTPPITPPAPYPFNPNPVLDDYPKTISQPSNPDPLELPDPKVAATLVNSGSAREYAKVIANEQPKLDLKPRSLPVKKLYENIAKERESVFGKVCNLFDQMIKLTKLSLRLAIYEINPIPDGNRKINQQTLNLQVSIAARIFQKHDYVGKFVFDGEELVSEHNMFGKMFDCRFVSYENDNYIFYLNVEIKYRLIGGQKQVFIFDPGGRLIVGQLAPMGTRGSILYLNEKMLQLGIKLQLPRSTTGQNFDIMSDRLPITDIMAFSSISCSGLDPFGEQPNISEVTNSSSLIYSLTSPRYSPISRTYSPNSLSFSPTLLSYNSSFLALNRAMPSYLVFSIFDASLKNDMCLDVLAFVEIIEHGLSIGNQKVGTIYAFVCLRFDNDERRSILVKSIAIGFALVVDVMNLKDDSKMPPRVQMNVEDHVEEEYKHSNLTEMFKNLHGFVQIWNTSIFNKLDTTSWTFYSSSSCSKSARENGINNNAAMFPFQRQQSSDLEDKVDFEGMVMIRLYTCNNTANPRELAMFKLCFQVRAFLEEIPILFIDIYSVDWIAPIAQSINS